MLRIDNSLNALYLSLTTSFSVLSKMKYAVTLRSIDKWSKKIDWQKDKEFGQCFIFIYLYEYY